MKLATDLKLTVQLNSDSWMHGWLVVTAVDRLLRFHISRQSNTHLVSWSEVKNDFVDKVTKLSKVHLYVDMKLYIVYIV